MKFRFPKSEHITLQRDIDALFSVGSHSAVAFPVRAVWHETEWDGHGPRVKVLVSVSKRKFKHAVDRNRAKRQMREAYRLNKHLLNYNVEEHRFISEDNALLPLKALHIGFLWLADTPQKSELVHKRIVNLLQRIQDKCYVASSSHLSDSISELSAL